MPYYQNAGLDLHYVSRGGDTTSASNVILFQHSLGEDLRQASRFLRPDRALISEDDLAILHADFRGHGKSSLGSIDHLSIETLATDMVALLDHLAIPRAVVGGISMGAAAALRMAVDYPERCRALILCRPAWIGGKMSPEAREACALIAELLDTEDWLVSAAPTFKQSRLLHYVEAICPTAAESLRGRIQSVINRPGIREATISCLRYLPFSRGLEDLASLTTVRCPTLILAAEGDPTHPSAFARELFRRLPYCRLVPIALDDTLQEQEIDRAIGGFLRPIFDRRHSLEAAMQAFSAGG